MFRERVQVIVGRIWKWNLGEVVLFQLRISKQNFCLFIAE